MLEIGSVLVEPDNDRDMELGAAIADIARGMSTDKIHAGVLLVIAIATYAKQIGLIETREQKLIFADGVGSMLAHAITAVENHDG